MAVDLGEARKGRIDYDRIDLPRALIDQRQRRDGARFDAEHRPYDDVSWTLRYLYRVDYPLSLPGALRFYHLAIRRPTRGCTGREPLLYCAPRATVSARGPRR